MNYRAWQLNQAADQDAEALHAEGFGVLLSRVLAARGVHTAEAAHHLLDGRDELTDPFLLKDMDKAVERIQRAVEEGEPIVIFGDYDVDGVSATAILFECLSNQGAQVRCKLPSRDGGGRACRGDAGERTPLPHHEPCESGKEGPCATIRLQQRFLPAIRRGRRRFFPCASPPLRMPQRSRGPLPAFAGSP